MVLSQQVIGCIISKILVEKIVLRNEQNDKKNYTVILALAAIGYRG